MRQGRDWDDELEAHIAMRAERNRQRGMSPGAARGAAEKAFGNQTQITENVRTSRVPEWLDQLRQDFQYAWRVRNAGLERASAPEFYTVKRHLADDARAANTVILADNPLSPPFATRSGG